MPAGTRTGLCCISFKGLRHSGRNHGLGCGLLFCPFSNSMGWVSRRGWYARFGVSLGADAWAE